MLNYGKKNSLKKWFWSLKSPWIFSPKILCEQCDISGLACLNKLNIKDIALGFQLVFWASSSHILLGQGHFLLILVTVNDWFLLEDALPGLLPIGQVSFKCYLPSKTMIFPRLQNRTFFEFCKCLSVVTQNNIIIWIFIVRCIKTDRKSVV